MKTSQNIPEREPQLAELIGRQPADRRVDGSCPITGAALYPWQRHLTYLQLGH